MPLYDFRCEICRKVEEDFAGYEEREKICRCGGRMKRLVSFTFGIAMGVPAGGYFDENLGVYINSNRHKKQVMEEQGVSEAYGKGWY
jgi:putative FmdB family regulatory protein